MTAHEKALSRMPVAYFLTCLAMAANSPDREKVALSYFDPVRQAVPNIRPLDLKCFAGALDYAKMNVMYRMIMKSKMKKQGIAEGDYRDWPAIGAWAEAVAPKLIGGLQPQ